jgi:citrate synthase
MCIMLCADHGPCVSGAHNAIVTARAGKDLVSSLVSGILLSLAHLEPIIFSGFVQGRSST